MLLDPTLASIFLRGYTGLMAQIYVSDPAHQKRATVAEVVAKGRADMPPIQRVWTRHLRRPKHEANL